MPTELAILYTPRGGRSLTVARLADSRLLLAVAEAAIAESEQRAEALAEADQLLAAAQREEAGRLRRVLELVIPELRGPACRERSPAGAVVEAVR